jgi:hypothetical protein
MKQNKRPYGTKPTLTPHETVTSREAHGNDTRNCRVIDDAHERTEAGDYARERKLRKKNTRHKSGARWPNRSFCDEA